MSPSTGSGSVTAFGQLVQGLSEAAETILQPIVGDVMRTAQQQQPAAANATGDNSARFARFRTMPGNASASTSESAPVNGSSPRVAAAAGRRTRNRFLLML